MAMLERSARVRLFHLKHLKGEKGKLSFNVTREVCEYLADPLLVQVTRKFLCFFHFSTSTWGPKVLLRTQIQVDDRSRWVVLEGRMFCCGGGRSWFGITRAYMLEGNGDVKQKANMGEGRMGHGLLAINNAAYVFGGYRIVNPVMTCEKWNEDKWSNLPSMREGRCCFNPCMLKGRVYLCGKGSELVEVFSPQTDTFLPLLVTFPEASPCCLYADNHLLVVHSESCILKFAVSPAGQLTQRSEAMSPQISKWQNSQPVVDKANGVFYMIWDGKCVCVNMETGAQGPIVALD